MCVTVKITVVNFKPMNDHPETLSECEKGLSSLKAKIFVIIMSLIIFFPGGGSPVLHV